MSQSVSKIKYSFPTLSFHMTRLIKGKIFLSHLDIQALFLNFPALIHDESLHLL